MVVVQSTDNEVYSMIRPYMEEVYPLKGRNCYKVSRGFGNNYVFTPQTGVRLCELCNKQYKFLFDRAESTLTLSCFGGGGCVPRFAGKVDLVAGTVLSRPSKKRKALDDLVGPDHPDPLIRSLRNCAMTTGLAEYMHSRMVADSGTPSHVYDSGPMTGKWGEWWYYSEHKWRRDGAEGLRIRARIDDLLIPAFQKLRDGSDHVDLLPLINRMLTMLQVAKVRDQIVKECRGQFNVPGFACTLDSKPHLLGCANGVFDLDAGLFRDGTPSDLVSMCTQWSYQGGSWSFFNAEVAFMKKFFADVLGSEPIVNMMLILLAATFHGAKRFQKFYIWHGQGSNGKSKLAMLCKELFGDYCCNIPVSYFTQKRADSGKAAPELSRMKSRRIGFICEPEQNDTLNLGTLKEFTGGDSMFSRGLYSSGEEFSNAVVPMLLCNTLPTITDSTFGSWRRIVSIPFNCTFTENPTGPNERLRDDDIDQKIKKYAPMFAKYLLDVVYKKFKAAGFAIPFPDEVQQSTNEYKTDSDFYMEFFSDKIGATGCQKDFVVWGEVWKEFKGWLRESGMPVHSVPKKAEAKSYFEKNIFRAKVSNPQRVGIITFRGWRGFKFL